MTRSWLVRARVKRYVSATPDEIVSLSPFLLASPYTLGEVTSEVQACFTRWGARRQARRLNSPPAVMYEVVVERAS